MRRRALGRDASLSLRMLWAMGVLAFIYGVFALDLIFFVVLWIWVGGAGVVVGLLPVAVAAVVLVWFRSALATSGARLVSASEEPRLHTLVDRLCGLAGLPKPRLAVLDSRLPGAFTTGVLPSRSTIVVTTALPEKLNPGEIEAVLAHELAHIANRDGAVMTLAAYPVCMAAWVARRVPKRALWLLVLPMFWAAALGALLVYWIAKSLTESLARCRELAADRGAVIITGAPEYLMSALQKISADAARIPDADLRRVEALNALFIVPAGPLTRTHPPLEARLAALAGMARELGKPDATGRLVYEEPEPAGDRVLRGVIVALAVVCVVLFVLVVGQQA